MNLVVDCSFVMSNFLPSEEISSIQYELYKIYVPSIFFLECGSALQMALKKNRININDFDQYIEAIRNLPLNVDKFSSEAESLYFIGKLSQDFNLTSYDASYLELSIRTKAKLATFDKQLASAAKLSDIELVS